MWCCIWCWSAPDSLKTGDEDQPRTARWRNEAHITRLPPTTTTYILAQCCRGISLPLIPITRLPPATTRHTGTTKYARGLLYFTNYHVHDHEGFNGISNRWKQALRDSIYRPKERRTWTRSTNEISLTKGTVKKIGLNNGWLRREGTVLEDRHIRKNIPAQYNPWTKGIYTQPPPYNYIWQQQTIKEYAKTSHPSSSWTKQQGYTLGGCMLRNYSDDGLIQD